MKLLEREDVRAGALVCYYRSGDVSRTDLRSVGLVLSSDPSGKDAARGWEPIWTVLWAARGDGALTGTGNDPLLYRHGVLTYFLLVPGPGGDP